MSTDLAKLVVRLEAQTAEYDKRLEASEKRARKFSSTTLGIFRGIGSAIAGALTLTALEQWGERILGNADQLNKLAQSSGIGVESLSRLQYAFKLGNVDAEAFRTGLKELNKTISEAAGNAKSEAAAAFKIMGVSVRDANGNLRASDQILADVADRFASYADGANKSALAQSIFGRQGVTLIPTLNQGADGLKRLGDEAERVGAVLSSDTTAAAEQFNDSLTKLKVTLVDGIGNQVAEKLLPILNELAADFTDTADGAESLGEAADFVATIFKGLISVGISVSALFTAVGRTLGAVGAAIVALLHGNIGEAQQILHDNYDDIGKTSENLQKRLAIVWREGGDDVIKEIKITAKRIKEEAPNLSGAVASKDVENAFKAAVKRLQDLNANLSEQVATYDKGDAAATRYRLTVGNLADDVKLAGKAGAELRDSIIGQAEALERLSRAKEIASGLAEVNAQIKTLSGQTLEADLIRFDESNAELVKKLRQDGNEAGLQQLSTLRALIAVQGQYNKLQTDAARIQGELADTEERIQNSRRVGAITELDALNQTGAARKKAAEELAAIAEQEQKIAEASGNPELIDSAKRFGVEVETLKSQTDLLAQKFESVFEDGASNALADFITGTKTAGQAITDLLNDIASQLIKLASQNLIQGLFGGSSSGGIGGFFASLFGGGRAGGGPVEAGMAYRVNENRSDSEWFVPDRSGHVQPAAKAGGGQHISQTFILQAPTGSVSRSTQNQVGAAAARGLANASRRNN